MYTIGQEHLLLDHIYLIELVFNGIHIYTIA